MDEIDYSKGSFEDIVAKDPRYAARAYALLSDVLTRLFGSSRERHVTGADILDEFRESTLDQFGPLSFRVLSEWGVRCTEDVGEMMFNLVDGGRISRDDGDSREDFIGGYDFEEAFLGPYRT